MKYLSNTSRYNSHRQHVQQELARFARRQHLWVPQLLPPELFTIYDLPPRLDRQCIGMHVHNLTAYDTIWHGTAALPIASNGRFQHAQRAQTPVLCLLVFPTMPQLDLLLLISPHQTPLCRCNHLSFPQSHLPRGPYGYPTPQSITSEHSMNPVHVQTATARYADACAYAELSDKGRHIAQPPLACTCPHSMHTVLLKPVPDVPHASTKLNEIFYKLAPP